MLNFLRIVPKKYFGLITGTGAELKVPKWLLKKIINHFIRIYNIDMSEVVIPETGFNSFDEFFTRKLESGARPIDDGQFSITSPSDGKIINCGKIIDNKLIQAKGKDYLFNDLIDYDELSKIYKLGLRFVQGDYLTIYLSPKDYHRLHSPVDSKIIAVGHSGNEFYPVNDFAINNIKSLYTKNERVMLLLETGRRRLIMLLFVAAMGVGNIKINKLNKIKYNFWERLENPIKIRKGEDLGAFNIGSTVIVLFENNMANLEKNKNKTKVGQKIARLI